MIRRVAAAAMLAASALVGTATPYAVGALNNDWLGLRTPVVGAGVSATCELGGANGTDAVWVGIGGTASLDIVQVGAQLTRLGPRYFTAHGRGEPGAAGSQYGETDLGPATTGRHAYVLMLAGGTWTASIDGRSVAAFSDAFRTWAARSSQVMDETQGDTMGGTLAAPVRCSVARVIPAWSMSGYGSAAVAAHSSFGTDWFAVTR